jgi:SAM-dependent methyltransferase
MWDQRYGGKEYAYGTEPNEFLVAMASRLPTGRVLCLGEGEGRNAVWLAGQGYDVTAVDASRVGLEKAQRLAVERGVTITTVHSDLAAYDIDSDTWDGILSVFCHLPPQAASRPPPLLRSRSAFRRPHAARGLHAPSAWAWNRRAAGRRADDG